MMREKIHHRKVSSRPFKSISRNARPSGKNGGRPHGGGGRRMLPPKKKRTTTTTIIMVLQRTIWRWTRMECTEWIRNLAWQNFPMRRRRMVRRGEMPRLRKRMMPTDSFLGEQRPANLLTQGTRANTTSKTLRRRRRRRRRRMVQLRTTWRKRPMEAVPGLQVPRKSWSCSLLVMMTKNTKKTTTCEASPSSRNFTPKRPNNSRANESVSWKPLPPRSPGRNSASIPRTNVSRPCWTGRTIAMESIVRTRRSGRRGA
mmetsp:Transcript_1748/g.3505  ORF Transcript_1748/g.3505 Transcript_1748/m.3505 type:complete len:257 (+) Transcript_1748:513-1283(+)